MEQHDVVEDKSSKAPDGGWGWFACLGSSLITLSLRSLDPSFGLIFDDLLVDLKVDSTETSSVLSVLDACSNFSGIFVGPLLNRFSYRTVAAFGSILSSTGLMLTAFANSIGHIVISYSILTGIGNGLAVASAFVALNTYFDKKRGQAVSFSSAGTALAMMLVPQAAHYFLGIYGFRGTMLIFGAWSMHSIVGACLLRPLGVEKLKKLNNDPSESAQNSLLPKKNDNHNGDLIDRGRRKKKECHHQLIAIFRELFNVELLKNQSYLNVIFGLSLFNVAEVNFKLMTPFFLRHNVGMTTTGVAFCLSLTAFTDIVARLVLPIIYDKLGFRKRRLFWINILFVAIGRSVLAERSKGLWLYIVLVINGFIRGAAIQNMLLSVSETCSLKNLPNAFGLYMVSKGLFSLALSPLVGYVRDYSDSYRICIHAMNILIFICFINWSIEFIYQYTHRREIKIDQINT